MIFDCFPFCRGLDVLEVRLRELAPVVDAFVLVESPQTFVGREKPLHFAENADRFREFADKVRLVVAPEREEADPWRREEQSRNAILEGMRDARGSDVVLLSDVDEIPAAEDVARMAAVEGDKCVVFAHWIHYYYLNRRNGARSQGTRLCNFNAFSIMSPGTLRHRIGDYLIPSGWHYSYMGDMEAIREKLAAFSHSELCRPPFNTSKHIEHVMESGEDLFLRGGVHEIVPVDSSFPRWVRDHEGELRARGLLA